MVDRLTHADFTALIGERFDLSGAAPGLELELVEAAVVGASPGEGLRAPFSLVFRGPRAPLLPQHVYPLRHSRVGTLEMFLVPIGPDAGGQRYEAVFA